MSKISTMLYGLKVYRVRTKGIGRSIAALLLLSPLCCALTALAVRGYHSERSKSSAVVDTRKMASGTQSLSSSTASSTVLGTGRIGAEVRTIQPTSRPVSRSINPESTAPRSLNVQSTPHSGRLEVEVVTIHMTGFEPSQIKRPAGRFLLAVDNRCGLEEVRLRLDRETGVRIHQANVRWDKLDWRQMTDLPPGTYLLTEENHPKWLCRITVGVP